MFDRINRSMALSRLFERLTARLAKQRGLLPMIGVILVAVSFVIQLVNVSNPSQVLDLLWTITHHLGLLIALIGLLLIEPLGR
ncbi:MAG: hypothetical protein GYB67_13470 [Chloroflexi bacterium]|nr:hypothetical protein [Chloroflexota bacterium]